MEEIKVFVSSTFKDLHEYRSYLVDHIYPRIEKLCWQKDIEFSCVDFRWGIPHTNINDIVKMCMGQISKCKPYFIGIIGDRYGSPFVDDIDFLSDEFPDLVRICKERETISITEMEFVEGILKYEKINENAYCYKIADGYSASEYTDIDIYLIEKRNEFIEKVRNKGYIFKEFDTPEKLGELILTDFKNYLDSLPIKNSNEEISDRKKKQKSTIYSKTKCYLQEMELQNLINDYLNFNIIANKPLFIYGPSGCGKSSFIAWNSRLLERRKDIVTITHFVGYEGSLNEKNVVDAILSEIREIDEIREIYEINAGMDVFSQFKICINSIHQNVVFLIDGINNAAQNIADLRFDWIPFDLPDNVRFIITCTDEVSLIAQASECNWIIKEIKLFQKEKSIKLVKNYLEKVHNKQLNNYEYEAFVEDNGYDNYMDPLYITTVMEEIVKVVNFIDIDKNEVKVKKELSNIIKVRNNMSDIIGFYMGLINKEELFNMVLLRIEHLFPERKEIIEAVLAALEASKSGLTYDHIIGILMLYQENFAQSTNLSNLQNFIEIFLEEMDFYIIKKGMKYSLFHASFALAISRKYELLIYKMRKTFIQFYLSIQNKNQDCNELYYQMYILKDWELMYKLISSSEGYQDFIYGVNRNDQIKYIEGVKIFHKINKLLIPYFMEKHNCDTLRLLFELQETKTAIKLTDILIPMIDKNDIMRNDIKYVFDKAINLSIKNNISKAFYYLDEYMKLSELAEKGINSQTLILFKYYADICLAVIEKNAPLQYSGQFNIKSFIMMFLPGQLCNNYILQPWLFKNQSAIKCIERLKKHLQDDMNMDASDSEVLYLMINSFYNDRGGVTDLSVKSAISLAELYHILGFEKEHTIENMLEGLRKCKQIIPFFDSVFGKYCMRIGQYYLHNTDENSENADLGLEYIYKSIVIFSKTKGVFCDEVIECIESILETYWTWDKSKSTKKGRDFNIEYIYRFYSYICDYLYRKKRRFLFLRFLFIEKNNVLQFQSADDIASFFETFSFIPSREYYIKRVRKNIKQKWSLYLQYTSKIVFAILFFMTYMSLINIYNVRHTSFSEIKYYFDNNNANGIENLLVHRSVFVNFKPETKYYSTAKRGMINILTQGNLIYAGWDLENCFYTDYSEGSYLLKYNRYLDKLSKIYDGKATLITCYKNSIYFLNENKQLCSIDKGKLTILIDEPVYKYLITGKHIYFIPFEKNELISSPESSIYVTKYFGYIDEHLPSYIKKCNFDGGNMQNITEERTSAFSIYNDKLYYINEDGAILEKDLVSGLSATIIQEGAYQKGLNISMGILFYFNGNRQMAAINLENKKKIILQSENEDLLRIAAFNNIDVKCIGSQLYFFAFNDTNKVIFSNPEEDKIPEYIDELEFICSIGLTSGKLYNSTCINSIDISLLDFDDADWAGNVVGLEKLNEDFIQELYKQ